MDTLSQASPLPIDCDSSSIASSTTRPSGRSANEGCWFCTFCTDHKSFCAKSDWKKHETRHHETGEDWPCPFRNCFRVFDRQADFLKHCQCHHPDLPPPTDIRIRLLPRVVYGCGFDGCKAVLIGWNERCNHVADQHMKKEGMTRSEWKYSNVIHNLLRQDATRNGWKELFSALETKQPRYQITWRPENTRILKQKLECRDMRPDIDVILHTALSLREGRPFNDVVELDPSLRTPSQDSIPDFDTLSQDQLNQILKGNPTKPVPRVRSNTLTAPTYKLSGNNMNTFVEPHPGTLVEFDIPSHTGGTVTDANGRRISYIMDIDQESLGLPSEPDPQIPPGLDLDPFQIDTGSSSKPIGIHYPHSFDTSSMFEGSPHQRRSSRGHIIPKSIRHFTSRLSPKQ
ncbi:hypothetical protein K469DRAFT_63884 [Zopfia rhizophila CBS 207.26]|uniref:C2H2-type domain-containing protein n=1 Tax=Zopfia rhizophila CBS 207.26 TaxID=1314779 RepID=A0A6A6EBI4_9PEZI|nr:hypothetical protein K469DRAFT_63884 [Zopfia rhizophila CBS 207.26]